MIEEKKVKKIHKELNNRNYLKINKQRYYRMFSTFQPEVIKKEIKKLKKSENKIRYKVIVNTNNYLFPIPTYSIYTNKVNLCNINNG
jgi:hypothetical protein